MAFELGVKLTQLCARDRKILRFCQEDGTLEKFEAVVRGMNSRPPKDMYSYFVKFICEKEYLHLASHVRKRFQLDLGGKSTCFKALGVVMVLRGRDVAFFLRANDHILKSDQRPQRIGTRGTFTVKTVNGADIPRNSHLFCAGFRNQLPSRGRPVPNGWIRKGSR